MELLQLGISSEAPAKPKAAAIAGAVGALPHACQPYEPCQIM